MYAPLISSKPRVHPFNSTPNIQNLYGAQRSGNYHSRNDWPVSTRRSGPERQPRYIPAPSQLTRPLHPAQLTKRFID